MKMKEINHIIEKHFEIKDEYDLERIYDIDSSFTNLDYLEKLELDIFIKEKKPSKLRVIFNYFLVPMVFLHELSHFLMMLLFKTKPVNFRIGNPKQCSCGSVQYNFSNNYIINIIIMVAPLILFLLAVFLPLINEYFLIFSIYSLISYSATFPSKHDMNDIKILFLSKNKLNSHDFYLISHAINFK